MTVAATLKELFDKFNYTWKVGTNKHRIPEENEIQSALDRCKKALYAEPVDSSLQVGRLIVNKWDENRYDVYLHIGEI